MEMSSRVMEGNLFLMARSAVHGNGIEKAREKSPESSIVALSHKQSFGEVIDVTVHLDTYRSFWAVTVSPGVLQRRGQSAMVCCV
jgi:hypothetical protein